MKFYRYFAVSLLILAVFAFWGCQSQELTSAKVYVQQRDYAKAEYNFLTAMDIEPENPEVPYLLAVEIYSNKNSGLLDYSKAKKYLDYTLERDPNYLPDQIKLFREQLYGATFNTAVGHYNSVIRNESSNVDEDLKKALDNFNLAAELRPNDPKAAIQIARIYSELKKDNISSIEYLDKAIERAPKSAELKGEKARILAKDDRVEEAIDMFDQALNANPESMEIGLRYAQFLYEHEMYEKSAEVYMRLIAVDPVNKDLYFNLGLTYLRLDDIDAAKDQFETVVALDPEDTQAIAMVGQVYFDLKDYISAEMYFRQLLEIEPENPDYLKRLGVTLTQQGRVEEGLEYYNRGRELESSY
ncbi:MAG: tetratricopeptide repeat protein [Candidatus Neomarinimicrobiota bacterium]